MGNRREATSVVTSTLMGLIDDSFNENKEDMYGSDVSNRIGVKVWRLDSAHKSDSDGQNWPEFNLENDMSNPRLKVVSKDVCLFAACKDGYRAGCRRIADTRHCVRHLHANFKKAGFQTKELKCLLRKAGRASTTSDFKDVMDELRKTNQHAYDW
ncbi:hypothetical protein PVK06_016689 [Gossypium arboreum]|uniref:Uncharacterized protein n=1 Tax=Gossypium arboreum TaxID=29729 RepID=A0ABR0Q1E7_GOSAR|nr:hypothetical protein PVK06_016689 [Gossypium arboreum]